MNHVECNGPPVGRALNKKLNAILENNGSTAVCRLDSNCWFEGAKRLVSSCPEADADMYFSFPISYPTGGKKDGESEAESSFVKDLITKILDRVPSCLLGGREGGVCMESGSGTTKTVNDFGRFDGP